MRIKAPMAILVFLFCFGFSYDSFSALKGKTTGMTFDKALPEDISNENFPDEIESFDFPNASLLDLVKAIGKLTGINFIVDPALQGKKVSIIAPSPITVAEAYKAFLSALAANGYTVIRSGAFWKVASTQNAHKDNTEVYSGDYFPNTDQLITRIIKLQYINAKDFTNSIKWLLSQDNKISTHESSNSIILSDYGSVIERIMKIIHEMDVPGSEESIKVIQIEHASAEDLAAMLGELLSVQSRSRRSSYISGSSRKTRVNISPSVKKKAGGNLKISSIIPDPRTNSLVVSANQEGFKRVRELVRKLDTFVDASRTGGVYVYNVLYGTAEEVYNTLMGIKPSPSQTEKRPTFRENFSPNLPRGVGFVPRAGGSQSPLFQNVTIMADSNTNSLIISAKNKYDYERVRAVLKKIDVPRDQVFIQAIIVEMIVQSGDNREVNLAGALSSIFEESLKDGRPWFIDILGSSVAGFLNQRFDIASLQEAQFGPGLILGLPFSKLLESIGSNPQTQTPDDPFIEDRYAELPQDQQRIFLNQRARDFENSPFNQALSTSFLPLIRLLKTVARVNVLSTPQLTTLDNVPAFIEVGENAPVGLTSVATVGNLAQNSVDRQDITLRLDIVPRINPESGTVQMDIKQKFDDFSNRGSSASELASRGVHIIKRNIETKMVLNDGETAVLGGLLIDKETKAENKVPVLGDIPVLGWLFKGSDVQKEKRNLLVFITPTIVKGEEQKEKTKEILGRKLDERIHFIKKYMKGRDPHGEVLQDLIPGSEVILDNKKTQKKKRKWFWQKKAPTEDLFLDEESKEENIDPFHEKEGAVETDMESDGTVDPDDIDMESDGETDFDGMDLSTEDAASFFKEENEDSFLNGNDEEALRPEDFQPAVPMKDDFQAEEEDRESQTQEENEEEDSLSSKENLEEENFTPIPQENFGF